MPIKKRCASCVHWYRTNKRGPGLCTLYPTHLDTTENHYCGQIKYKRTTTVSTKKRDERMHDLANVYRNACREIYGRGTLILKHDWGNLRHLMQDRSTEEVEWIILEYLQNPPEAPLKRRNLSISAIAEAVRRGMIIDREHIGRDMQIFLDSQMQVCKDPDVWDEYEKFVVGEKRRITFREWDATNEK